MIQRSNPPKGGAGRARILDSSDPLVSHPLLASRAEANEPARVRSRPRCVLRRLPAHSFLTKLAVVAPREAGCWRRWAAAGAAGGAGAEGLLRVHARARARACSRWRRAARSGCRAARSRGSATRAQSCSRRTTSGCGLGSRCVRGSRASGGAQAPARTGDGARGKGAPWPIFPKVLFERRVARLAPRHARPHGPVTSC